ncbi:hypothetical protein, partial [Zobellella denitrificans]|uniref:hypothetical protein n=1 Tax=Zobellella denitrificans TaxID=347534 RepID=UPI001C3D81F8
MKNIFTDVLGHRLSPSAGSVPFLRVPFWGRGQVARAGGSFSHFELPAKRGGGGLVGGVCVLKNENVRGGC